MIKVFKFGGASVRDAAAIENLYNIVSCESGCVVAVISALGKTTNLLEEVHLSWRVGDDSFLEKYNALTRYHLEIASQLLGPDSEPVKAIGNLMDESGRVLISRRPGKFDIDYDFIVSQGEVWSTMIVESYLKSRGLNSRWVDIRRVIVTDNRHRDADVIWEASAIAALREFRNGGADIYVTQGFIGATAEGLPTTLGREGSDYTAALLANMLDAEKVVVWKDVPGVMTADPKWMPSAVTLDRLSYNEAVEMTFSGARVIHPKTIKPLHNKNIPMEVRSFIDPMAAGTLISCEASQSPLPPVYVKKEKQILISVIPKDLSFVMGDIIAGLFHTLADKGLKVNLVQTGAVSINICADNEEHIISPVLERLASDFSILYNDSAEMITVRHHTPAAVEMVTAGREVLLSQTTRNSVRVVVR
jgi:aspartate kinase